MGWSAWQPGFIADSALDNTAGSPRESTSPPPALVHYFSRVDYHYNSVSTISLHEALGQARLAITSGTGIDETDNPGPGAASAPLGVAYYAHSSDGYHASNVGLGYQAYSISPPTAYLPPRSSSGNIQPVFENGTEGVNFGEIPPEFRGQMHARSDYDTREGDWYVDWEQAGSTWRHWTTLFVDVGVRWEYYMAYGSTGPPAPWHGPATVPVAFGTSFPIPGGAGTGAYSPALAPDHFLPGLGELGTVDVTGFVIGDGDFTYDLFSFAPGQFDLTDQPRDFGLYAYLGWITGPPGDLPWPDPFPAALADVQIKLAENLDPWPGGSYLTPRWRYWVPEDTNYVRLTQRNDGLGIQGHPRLNRGAGMSSSRQSSGAPRVNRSNTYS